jgi:EmrB/QacA subfamily drug resistance transporter
VSAGAPSPWIAFSAVAVGTFMGTVDSSIVNVALPTMRAELGTTIAGAEWVVTAYLLTVSAALLSAGRLGDVAGHRRIFVAGLLLFTLGSALCGFAPGLATLVAARMVQALGASAMTAIGPAVVTAAFPPQRRGRALGAITSVVAVGLTAGPPLGGLLVQHLSWRWIFWVNLPVGVAGAIWASRSLPETAGALGARLDPGGSLLLAGCVIAALGAVRVAPSSPALALLLALSAAGAVAGLARRSRRIASPVLDLGLFRRPTFSVGILAGFLSYASLFTATLMNPFYLSQVMGLPPRDLGAIMVVVPLAMSLSSTPAGWLADRFPSRALGPAGMALVAAGLGGLAALGAQASILAFAVRQAALGLGMGLFQPPNNSAIMGSLPRERLGSGGGMLATARTMGMAMGIALAGALFHGSGGDAPGTAAFLGGYRAALLAGAGLAVAAGVVSALVTPVGRGPAAAMAGGGRPEDGDPGRSGTGA